MNRSALLIAATGTGKTFLSAFDVKKVNPKKFLFVVHRLNIAEASMRAYQLIFGKTKKMGIYSGSQKDLAADFIFCTIQTLSKEEGSLKFSSHAMKRLNDRSISMDSDEFLKLRGALDKLKTKGGKDSLVLTSKAAYIMDVPNNTIVTAMDKSKLGENVFTKIDSTLILD